MAKNGKTIKELEEEIEILKQEKEEMKKKLYENPPEGTFVLIKQPDGNFKGFALKNRQIIVERQYDPQIVLQLLLVHG